MGTKNRLLKIGAASVVMSMILAVVTPLGMAAELPSELVPMGNSVGITIEAQGIMVVGVPKVLADGSSSPAYGSGLAAGDIIIKINTADIETSEDLKNAVSFLGGADASITVLRGGKEHVFTVTPKQSKDGGYELGIWMRDGISGIGTVTYFDPESGTFGALGHSINDADSGLLFPLKDGQIIGATVSEVIVGRVGAPGQLKGEFSNASTLGDLLINSESGVFGLLTSEELASGKESLPVAARSEIKTGPAVILSNVSGTEVGEYDIEITRLYTGAEADGRCMMIRVTDSELIAKTGGIVQGMSGSPIIQDGKIIGAVTHVLVNDPERGYGISIEEMLATAENGSMDNAA